MKRLIEGCENVETVEDVMKSKNITNYVDKCLALTNEKAISRA